MEQNERYMERLVDKYVKLRDKIEEIEELQKKQLAPYKDMLSMLDGVILDHLNAAGCTSVRTSAGTAGRSSRHSASIVDKTVFWDWVVNGKRWDFIDKKANTTAVHDYIEEHKTVVPGVNFSTRSIVSVTRATSKVTGKEEKLNVK